MKLRLYSVLALAAALGFLFQPGGRAGGASAQEKKEDSKDVVVNAELINADLLDKKRTNCYCKTYPFKMTEGKTYTLDMTSGTLDSYLRLEDAEGKQLAEDDDSGGSLNARIVFRAPKTAAYQIICTSFTPALGKFTLTVKNTAK